MALSVNLLASGPGWRVSDVICDSGPRDPRFEERHDGMCVAAVTRGTFQYRSTHGAAVLAPGAILLGDDGQGFECGHDHSTGDRCLAFHLSPGFFEGITNELQTPQKGGFGAPCLPPVGGLAPLLGAAQAARDAGDVAQLEELAVRITATVAVKLNGLDRPRRSTTAAGIRRVSEVLRWVEGRPGSPLTLGALAGHAAMSPFHFLRTFRAVVGVTPYQYLLRMRLQRACFELRGSGEPVATIAFKAGFSDLSSFNRQFRRSVKVTPSTYRLRGLGPVLTCKAFAGTGGAQRRGRM
jgi:AraC family transcriptional regulator